MKNARAATPGVNSRVAPQEARTEHSQDTQAEPGFGPEYAISSDLRRVMAGPQTFNPATIMRLQHTIGNRSVQRLLQGNKPQTALARTAPNVVQRAKTPHPTYTSQAGQTWKDIATLHGFFSTTIDSKMTSFFDTNGIGLPNLNEVVTTGRVVKLPRGTVAPTTTTTTVTGTGGATTVAASGPPLVPAQAELGTVLSAIGKFLDWAASKPGDKYSFEFGFRVPVYGGIFMGMKLSGEAERDSADSNGVAPLKLDTKLGIEGKASYTFLYYGQVDFGASLVRNIKAESTRGGTGAMEAFSFGLYRSVQETSYIPGRIMNWIWGNDREAWSARTAGRIAGAEDKAFVGTAASASVGGSFGGEEGGEGTKFGVEAVVSKGTEYSKDSIESKGVDDGAGGRKGTMSRGWTGGSYESSLGESKTTMEFSGKMEILGSEASFKLAREGTEWGIEAGISLGTFSKLEGDSPTEKITKLYEKIGEALGGAGSKLPEQVKGLAKVASLSKKVIRNSNQIAGLLTSGLPGKDQFALVLYQGMSGPSKPSTALVPYSGGGTSTGLVPSGSGGGLPTGALSGGTKPLMLQAPSGWYNVDEGKTEADAKFLLGLKYNITKKEFEAGLDVSFEAGFDSSALTVKGAKTKRLLKWKRP